jgi:hypothetical protein
MSLRKHVAIALLAGLTFMNGLALAITQTPLFPLLAQYVEDHFSLTIAVVVLVMLMAIAMTAIGYGIGVDVNLRRAGRSRVLYRRSPKKADSRRTERFETSAGIHNP